MRLHGYCQKCHRVKRVTAPSSSVAMAVQMKRIVIGVCDQCLEPKEEH